MSITGTCLVLLTEEYLTSYEAEDEKGVHLLFCVIKQKTCAPVDSRDVKPTVNTSTDKGSLAPMYRPFLWLTPWECLQPLSWKCEQAKTALSNIDNATRIPQVDRIFCLANDAWHWCTIKCIQRIYRVAADKAVHGCCLTLYPGPSWWMAKIWAGLRASLNT